MYQQRTRVENPYCGTQFANGKPCDPLSPYAVTLGLTSSSPDRGWCPDCERYVNLRKNGTAKIHRTYGRRDMARRIAAWKRGEEL